MPTQHQRGSQHVVDAGLPAIAGGPQRLEDVNIQTQLHWLLGQRRFASQWAAAPTRSNLFGCVHLTDPPRFGFCQGFAQPRQRLDGVEVVGERAHQAAPRAASHSGETLTASHVNSKPAPM